MLTAEPRQIAALSAAFPNVFQLPEYFLRLDVTPPAAIVFRILRPDQFLKYLGGERVQLQPLIGIPVAAGATWSIDRQPWLPGPQVLVVDPAVDGEPPVPGVEVSVIGRGDLPGGGAPMVGDELEVEYNGWRPATVTRVCLCAEHPAVKKGDPPFLCPGDSRQILQPGQFQVDSIFQDGSLSGRAFGMLCSNGEEGLKWRWPATRR